MTRPTRLTALFALAIMVTGFASACTSASDPLDSAGAGSPLSTVAAPNSASPSASGASTRPRLILDGLLKTAAGERVISDAVTDYESRAASSWQAATRSPINPISSYRSQLLDKGWRLSLDEPTSIAAQLKGDWVALTSTDVESFTKSESWATVFAYTHLTKRAADL